MPPSGHVLLASDGLMRLVYVFKLYMAPDLFSAALNEGLTPLVQLLRKSIDTRAQKAMMTPQDCCCAGRRNGQSRVGSAGDILKIRT